MGEFFADGGTWRRIAEDGRLLVFERTDGGRDEREIRMCGVFDETGDLAMIINVIHMASLDGALHVSSGADRVVLYFRKGSLLSGRSTGREDRLGEILLRGRRLDRSQINSALDETGDQSVLGKVLVRKRLLTTQEVYAALQDQTEAILGTALRMGHGTYCLIAPLDISEVPAMLHMSTQTVLLNALRRIDEEKARALLEPKEGSMDRRSSPEELTSAGASALVDTYNEALQRLFAAVPAASRSQLLTEAKTLLHDNARPFHEAFKGVVVQPDGRLDKIRLLANLDSNKELGSAHLQVGLSELLFFMLFAVGDSIDVRAKAALHREVTEAMKTL
jgi:hypothetical protein